MSTVKNTTFGGVIVARPRLDASEKKPRVRNDIKGTGQNWRKGKTKYSAEEINKFCLDYFEYCLENKRKPTLEGLAGKMDITSETLKIWINANKEDSGEVYNPDVSSALKKAMDYITDELQQGNDAMSVFRLKQPHYGGYTDKQQVEANNTHKLEIKITGVEAGK